MTLSRSVFEFSFSVQTKRVNLEVKIIRVKRNSQTKRVVTTTTVSKVTVVMRGVSPRESLRRNQYRVVPVLVSMYDYIYGFIPEILIGTL